MKQKGQNLAEYSIAVGLIAIVSIGALSVLGQNIAQGLGDSISIASNGTGAGNINGVLQPTNLNNPFPNLPGQRITVDLGNGKFLNLDMADPASVAEAAGGNGVTENALAVLKQAIDQLREQGEDPGKIKELENLAREGQKIKDLQKLIESKFPQGGFASTNERFDFLTNPANNIEFNGQTMSLLEASGSLNLTFSHSTPDNYSEYDQSTQYTQTGYYDVDDTKNYFNYNNNNLVSQHPGVILDFMRQLELVENTGILSNPALKQLVKNDLSRQIFTSAGQTFQAPTRADVSALVQTTRSSSNNICTLANSVDCQDRTG